MEIKALDYIKFTNTLPQSMKRYPHCMSFENIPMAPGLFRLFESAWHFAVLDRTNFPELMSDIFLIRNQSPDKLWPRKEIDGF